MIDIYVAPSDKRQKPTKVGEHDERRKIPATVTHDGKTYYFAAADLTERFLVYSANKPRPVTA